MEGERIAKALSVYADRRSSSSSSRPPNRISTSEAITPDGGKANGAIAAAAANDGGNTDQKQQQQQRAEIRELTEKAAATSSRGSCSDGISVELHELNDYTSERLKEEQHDIETTGIFKTIQLCSGCQGGEQDNPKVVTAGVGNIVEKWELTFRLLRSNLAGETSRTAAAAATDKEGDDIEEDEAELIFTRLNRCTSFDDLFGSTSMAMLGKPENLIATNFIDTLNESNEKITLHGLNLTKYLLERGEVRMLTVLLGSMILAKNRLDFYSSDLASTVSKGCPAPFAKSRAELSEIIEAVTAQILDYHCEQILTLVLHDADSQDWSSAKAFFEGGRVSPAVQFWGFHLQGLRSDLYNTLPPRMAQALLARVLDGSLGCIAARYCQIRPSPARMPQYRADLTGVLLVAHDLLTSLVPGPSGLFSPSSSSSSSCSIHAKCGLLLSALTIVTCPVKIMVQALTKVTAEEALHEAGAKKKTTQEKNLADHRLVNWLHLLLPGTYGNSSSSVTPPNTTNNSSLGTLVRLCASQPTPRWPLVVRLCLAHNMQLSQLVLRHCGAFVPAAYVGTTTTTPGSSAAATVVPRSMREGCGNLLCARRCLGAADIFWPQVVGSGILYIVMHGNPEKSSLIQVLEPLLRKLSPSSWDVLNVSFVWNVKKPVWFQGLLDLLEPYFHPIFEDLVDDLESGRTWTLDHVPKAIDKMNANILDVCELIESLIPDDVRPICDSVVAHLFVSCIYGIINKLLPVFREWKMSREKLDFLAAVGEKLCNLDTSNEMQKLEGLTDASSNARTEKNHRWDDSPEEFLEMISEMIANHLLSEPLGQESLKAVNRFVSYNSDWLQHELEAAAAATAVASSSDSKDSSSSSAAAAPISPAAAAATDGRPKIIPWEEKTFKVADPYETCANIGGVGYSSLFDFPHPWEDSLRFLFREGNPALMLRLLLLRPELTSNNGEAAAIADVDKAMAKEILMQLRKNIDNSC